jgi:hypothetical protein
MAVFKRPLRSSRTSLLTRDRHRRADLRDPGKVFIFLYMSYLTQAIAAHAFAFSASALLPLPSLLLAGLLLRASAN